MISTLLIKGNFDVNYQDDHGDTPLHIAGFRQADFSYDVLMLNGAHDDIMNKFTETPYNLRYNQENEVNLSTVEAS